MRWLAILLIVCETLTILGHIEAVIRSDFSQVNGNRSESVDDIINQNDTETQQRVSNSTFTNIPDMKLMNTTTDFLQEDRERGLLILLIQVANYSIVIVVNFTQNTT